MSLNFCASSYRCDYVDFSASDDGKVVVTLSGNYPPDDEMTAKEVLAIVNDPLFTELFSLACHGAKAGTPLFRAFDRVMRGEMGQAVINFQQSDLEVAA